MFNSSTWKTLRHYAIWGQLLHLMATPLSEGNSFISGPLRNLRAAQGHSAISGLICPLGATPPSQATTPSQGHTAILGRLCYLRATPPSRGHSAIFVPLSHRRAALPSQGHSAISGPLDNSGPLLRLGATPPSRTTLPSWGHSAISGHSVFLGPISPFLSLAAPVNRQGICIYKTYVQQLSTVLKPVIDKTVGFIVGKL